MQSLNLVLTRDDLSRPWGFRLQGGQDTGNPLLVQRVFSGSPAEGLLQKGDILKSLDNCDVENLSGKEVQDIIRTSERQLNLLIERGRTETFQNPIEDADSKVSVKTVCKKFAAAENSVPKPFGTYYEKKTNTTPTNVMLDMQFQQNSDQMGNYHDQTVEVDDNVDYSFMTLSVKERKRLFATADDNKAIKTMPRMRSHSVRPSSRTYELPTKVGYHNNDIVIKSRPIAVSQSSPGFRLQTKKSFPVKYDQHDVITEPYATMEMAHSNPSNVRYNSAIHTNRNRPIYPQSTPSWHNKSEDLEPKVAANIYHCGGNQHNSPRKDRCTDYRQLVVKTYPIQPLPQSESPRRFRPDYSLLNQENSHGDNWSTFSTRSEPYSRRSNEMESCRQNADLLTTDRYSNTCLGVIHLGDANTRVVNNIITPSYQTCSTVWKSETPSHNYYVNASPVTIDASTTHRNINVTRSNSTISINPISRSPKVDTYSQVLDFKDHSSFAGGSDF